MYWLSGAEAEKFVRSVEDAYEKVKKMGPNPINFTETEQVDEENVLTVAPIE